ncbi:MAG: peptide chain release factor N(5)-glutamine methyltransferase [Candidatus Zixiibacteriota bacterium]
MSTRMTVAQWRQRLRECLAPVAGYLAPFEADRLLGEVVSAGPTELTVRRQELISEADEHRLQYLATDRLTGRPLSYVLGHVEFCGLDFLCDERALIPRPETEGLAEVALKTLPPLREGVQLLAIDVGTGSGNIALALAHHRPDLVVVATDISAAALALAGENRARVGLTERVHFVRGDTLSMFAPGIADIIVSNPPYVIPGDPNLDPSVSAHEPAAALYSGPTGVEFIAGLLTQSADVLRPGGFLVCEIGYDQGSSVRKLVGRDPRWGPPSLHRDLAGIERVAVAQRL